jgi:hypothetical protein
MSDIKTGGLKKGCDLNCTVINYCKANNMPFVILDSNYVIIFQKSSAGYFKNDIITV